jgi:hypothetical protein
MQLTCEANPKPLCLPQCPLHTPGNEVREITPKSGRIIGGIAVGGLFGIAGAGIVVGILETAGNPLWCLLGVGMLLLGAAIIVVMKRLASLRVLVTAEGIAIASLGNGKPGRCYRIEHTGLQPAL